MPDEFLTIDEVAERMALPPEMIRRRIESGDIPVHWVEVDGKLEMRVAADDVGGAAAAQAATPATPFSAAAEPELRPAAGETAASGWETNEEEYSQRLWAPVDSTAGAESPGPWVEAAAAQPAVESTPDEGADVPVWRPDPATWEDEQLESTDEATDESAPEFPSGFSGYQEQESPNATPFASGSPFAAAEPQAETAYSEEEESFAPPKAPAFGYGDGPAAPAAYSPDEQVGETADFEPPAAPGYGEGLGSALEPYSPEADSEAESPFSPSSAAEEEPAAPAFAAPPPPAFSAEEEPAAQAFAAPPPPAFSSAAAEEPSNYATSDQASQGFPGAYAAPEETAYPPEETSFPPEEADQPPSAMLASPTAGSLAMGSIDARELVAGLFERWERALEQRIQAEQRLRFEAELEQRMRQVRDLRQELDNTRKTQAAQLAEREREIMDLRSRLQDVERAPKGRGLFRR